MSRVEAWGKAACGIRDWSELSAWQEERMRRQPVSRFYADGIRFTTAADIRNDPYAFLCIPPKDVKRITTMPTSGTTGNPKRVFFSAGDLENTVAYFRYGMTELMDAGDACAIFLPGASYNSVGDLLGEGVKRLGGTVACIGAEPDPVRAAEKARDVDCIAGHPMYLLALSRYAPQLRPRSLLVTGDCIPAWVTEELERTWGCRIHPHYGLTEAGFGCAVRCRDEEGLQICHPFLKIDVIDPVTQAFLPKGEWGEIVITTVQREAMPLFLYRTGDEGRLLPGYVQPRLEVRDRITRARYGGALTPAAVDEAAFAVPGVRNMRAFDRDGVLVIEADGEFDRTEAERRIRGALGWESISVERGRVPLSIQKRTIGKG